MDYANLYRTDVDGLADWAKLPDIDPCVPALLAHCRKAWPDKDYVIFDDERVTYGEADARSAILARQLLAAGVGKGSRIGMIFPNSPAFMITWLAITRIGEKPGGHEWGVAHDGSPSTTAPHVYQPSNGGSSSAPATHDHMCVRCDGRGKIDTADAYGHYVHVTCPICGGSGRVN